MEEKAAREEKKKCSRPALRASPPQPHRFDNTNDHEPAEPSTFGISSKAPHVQVDAAASRGVSAGRT